MKVVEDRNAERLIRFFVPKSILKLKPVIAGGFALAMYEASKKISNDIGKLGAGIFFSDCFDPTPFGKKKVSTDWQFKGKFPGVEFGDIDLWFTKENEIWNKHSAYNFLVSDISNDVDESSLFNDKYRENSLPTFRINTQKVSWVLAGLNLESITNSTSWANTMTLASKELPVQFIKRQYDDIEDIFKNFDILNCCVAYYDGKFYLEDGADEANGSKDLIMRKVNNYSVLQKAWSVERMMKYSNRYNLELSKDSCDLSVEVFLELEEFRGIEDVEALKSLFADDFDNINNIKIDTAYGTKDVSVKRIRDMTNRITAFFPALLKQKNLNQDCLLWFINTNQPMILEYVKTYMEREEGKAPGEVIKLSSLCLVRPTTNNFDDLFSF